MNKLTQNHFSFKCPMNWNEMEVSENGRFCGKCRREVFDLTNCSIDEVIALQRKHGPICGSIKVAQAAVVAVSLSAAACKNVPEPRATAGIVCPPEQLEKSNQVPLSGTPMTPDQLEKMKRE